MSQSATLNFDGQNDIGVLVDGVTCYELQARRSGLRELPAVNVRYQIDLSDCQQLVKLPEQLRVSSLILQNCTQLQALPEGLDVCFLDVSGCRNLTSWPLFGRVRIGRFVARGCAQLTQLPHWINDIAQLNLRGCTALAHLPDGLRVTGWLDIGDTQITKLPAGCQSAELRWNGVRIDQRIAFAPETISADEVLKERNVEKRRVMMERMGVERFVAEVDADVLHEDTDPGGQRQLLRVVVDEDEPLVVLGCSCPSTARRYLLRVPPTMKTCHQAAAWIAGFDDATLYAPLMET